MMMVMMMMMPMRIILVIKHCGLVSCFSPQISPRYVCLTLYVTRGAMMRITRGWGRWGWCWMKKVRMIADDGEGEDLGHVVMGGRIWNQMQKWINFVQRCLSGRSSVLKSKISNLKAEEIGSGSEVVSGGGGSSRSVTPDDRSDGRAVLALSLVYWKSSNFAQSLAADTRKALTDQRQPTRSAFRLSLDHYCSFLEGQFGNNLTHI